MSLQLIGPRKSLSAKRPIAHERPFARVPPEMGSQMRRLSIDLVASGHMTNMLLLPIAASVRHYTIGACTRNATHSRLDILVAAHIYVDIYRRLVHGWLEGDGRWCDTDSGRGGGFSVT